MDETGLTHYCYHCYGENGRGAGKCVHCGEEIQAPPSTSYAELLVWALHHPIADVAMNAAATLGERRERLGRDTLRELALTAGDPYLAAQALHSLVRIDGAGALRPLLEQLHRKGSVPVRRVASAALRGAID